MLIRTAEIDKIVESFRFLGMSYREALLLTDKCVWWAATSPLHIIDIIWKAEKVYVRFSYMDFDAVYAHFDMPFAWLETVDRLNMQVLEKFRHANME